MKSLITTTSWFLFPGDWWFHCRNDFMTENWSLMMSVQQVTRRSTPDLLSEENWFHPTLSRDQAETVLRTAGYAEGLFLVRDSSSCPQVNTCFWLVYTKKYSSLIGWHHAILISDWLFSVFRILCCQLFTMMQWFTIRSENMAMMLFTHWDQVNTVFWLVDTMQYYSLIGWPRWEEDHPWSGCVDWLLPQQHQVWSPTLSLRSRAGSGCSTWDTCSWQRESSSQSLQGWRRDSGLGAAGCR